MPDNTQRLTSSSAPFVIQRRRARWHAEIPYGHPRLSSTKRNEFGSIRMMLVVRWWSFSKFLQVSSLSSFGNIQVQWRVDFFSAGQRRLGAMAKGSVVVVQLFVFKTLKFIDASDAFSFLTKRQVPLAGILTDWMMFRSNEISVLSLLPFYLQ